MKQYDVIVVGGGAGNIVLDAALEAGKTCAVVEKEHFGGTCLNRGCIPSKVLITVADHIRQMERDKAIGLNCSYSIDWQKMVERVRTKQSERHDILAEYQAEPNLDVYQGVLEFVSPHRVKVTLNSGTIEEFEGDTIILATGGRTTIPLIDGLDVANVVTSESFFAHAMPEQLYKSVVILGGGVIGVEFAHFFASVGVKVTLVGRNEKLIPKHDTDLCHALKQHLIEDGITVYTGADVVAAGQTDGRSWLSFNLRGKGEKHTVEGDVIFVCPGITPNADLLKLDKAGVKTTSAGWIITDEYLATNVTHIYAIGDANGKQQLRHKANYEAEILAHNLFGNGVKRHADYRLVPGAVFTHPQVASVGFTEAEAIKIGYDVATSRYDYFETAKGYALGEYDAKGNAPCFVKVVADSQTGEIIGVHAIGEEAALLVQPYAYLMSAGVCTREIFDNAMTIHPALAEVSGWAPSRLP